MHFVVVVVVVVAVVVVVCCCNQNYKDNDQCGGSHWRAAGNKPKRKGNLDETGLEIAGCRHGLAQWAVNMFQGELYGYAHFLQVKRMIPRKVCFAYMRCSVYI